MEQIELGRLLRALDQKTAANSFYQFVREAWHVVEPHEPFCDGWHIHAICEHLEATLDGRIRNLLINIPPRHMKSLLVNVFFPAWVWIKFPGMRFLFSSHASSLATRDSVKCRRLVASDWYRSKFLPHWELSMDQNAKTRFDNTEGGYRIATSVGGGGVGEGGDYIVSDDPHKPAEIYSETMTRMVREWWDETMANRAMNPKTVRRIVVMQRLGEADLSGHLIEKGDWDHICLPAEYEQEERKPTSIGWTDPRTRPGELLWPERFGPVELAGLKKDLGPRGVAGQLQQRPSPQGGNIWLKDWWKFYRELPVMDFTIQSWDLTFKDTEKGAFVVGQVWGKRGIDKYLIHQFRERIGFTAQLAAIEKMSADYPDTKGKYVEEAANGAALINVLKTKISGLVAVKPVGSKLARMESVAPEIQAGNVYIPDPELFPWVQAFIDEATVAPNGRYMDQVDTASQALDQLSKHRVLDWSPGSATQTSKFSGRRGLS